VARGYSGYLDSLLNKSMETAFRNAMPINVSVLFFNLRSKYLNYIIEKLSLVIPLLEKYTFFHFVKVRQRRHISI
jgi:hypothetical protein